MTFINKWDRPGREPLELIDEVESLLGVRPTPLTWPVGVAGDFRGVIDRRDGTYTRFSRTSHGATMAPEEILDPDRALSEEGVPWEAATEEVALLDEIGADLDLKSFLAAESTPVLFGSALTNFGVRKLLDAVVDLVPPPAPRRDLGGHARAIDAPFSGFVFKVQANMDRAHRDRIAFVRVCSGRFERGMVVTHGRTGKPFNTKYAHQVFGQERETVDEAYAGDVVGLVNANEVRVGDTLYLDDPVEYPTIPSFAPEHFRVARVLDTSKFKQFRKGIAQLDEEGVVQVLRQPEVGDQAPTLAAVGPMQFDVAIWRLENEFGAPVELNPTSWTLARRTDTAGAGKLRGMRGVQVLERADGTMLALFESQYWVQRLEQDQPDLVLEPLVAEGRPG